MHDVHESNKADILADEFKAKPMFCSEYTMTKETFSDFSSAAYSIPLIFFIIIFIMSLIYFAINISNANYSSLAMQEAIVLAISVLYFVLIKHSISKSYKRLILSAGVNTVLKDNVCFSDKITICREHSTPVEYNYDDITAVYESKKLFLLRMKFRLHILVSKDSFPGASRDAFIHFIFARCANIKHKRVKNISHKKGLCIVFISLTAAVFVASVVLSAINVYHPLPSIF